MTSVSAGTACGGTENILLPDAQNAIVMPFLGLREATLTGQKQEHFWLHLGVHFGLQRHILEPFGSHFGSMLGPPEPFWVRFGARLGLQEHIWAADLILGPIWGHFWGRFGPKKQPKNKSKF